jgi:hypothetical protein
MKTISRSAIKTITKEAHQAAHDAAHLFGEYYRFKQGYADPKQESLYALNGYENYQLDFVPLSNMVVGKVLKNKEPLKEIRATSVERLLRQSFVGNRAWTHGDTVVLTKDFIMPVIKFITRWAERIDVFAGIYQNPHTMTNVFGIYVKLRDVEGEDQLCWEITIDDVDLVKPSSKPSLRSLFC